MVQLDRLRAAHVMQASIPGKGPPAVLIAGKERMLLHWLLLLVISVQVGSLRQILVCKTMMLSLCAAVSIDHISSHDFQRLYMPVIMNETTKTVALLTHNHIFFVHRVSGSISCSECDPGRYSTGGLLPTPTQLMFLQSLLCLAYLKLCMQGLLYVTLVILGVIQVLMDRRLVSRARPAIIVLMMGMEQPLNTPAMSTLIAQVNIDPFQI